MKYVDGFVLVVPKEPCAYGEDGYCAGRLAQVGALSMSKPSAMTST